MFICDTIVSKTHFEQHIHVFLCIFSSRYSYSSYVNVFATYPLALLGAKGAAATLNWYKTYDKTADQFTYNSSSLYYTATYALAELDVSEGNLLLCYVICCHI